MLAHQLLITGLLLETNMYYAHIDENNILIGIYSDEVHEEIPQPSIQLTRQQWAEIVEGGHNKVSNDGSSSTVDVRTQEQVANSVRNKRNNLLKHEVDPIAGNTLRWDELASDRQSELASYRTALLDVPQQGGFPSNITWPTKPEWV